MSLDNERLHGSLTGVKLTAIRDQLDSLLEEAAKRELTLREALAFLVEREVARKDAPRTEMAGKIVHFPMAPRRPRRRVRGSVPEGPQSTATARTPRPGAPYPARTKETVSSSPRS
jgi:hypothetical protein